MSDIEPAPAAKQSSPQKLLIILIGCTLAISLVNTALLLLNPTASKVEAFNESLKTDLADSVASIHKKVDGLRSAEIEWQAVLKKASEKPAATYKIVKSGDGLLTLTELEATAPVAAEAAAPEPKK